MNLKQGTGINVWKLSIEKTVSRMTFEIIFRMEDAHSTEGGGWIHMGEPTMESCERK